jgi:potassium efflux system protein
MFANFVAGIIILFERPIRVGDIVTLDGVAGTVTKIRMRATTITNFDRQDYIVPNKDFITGRVLNWTLSDYVSRIVIPVGVAYGSDTEKTVATLMRMADEHEQIIDDPKPQVTFEEFGDSSLLFKLRVFIAMEHMPHRLQIIHQLHMAIDAAFREVGIEIAFPQRDLHIRTSMPLAEPKGAAADQKSNPGNGTFGERANKDRIK